MKSIRSNGSAQVQINSKNWAPPVASEPLEVANMGIKMILYVISMKLSVLHEKKVFTIFK